MELHEEAGTRFYADRKDIVSADMGVFYNPVMRENRDLSLLVIDRVFATRKRPTLLFPMVASGVRPLRLFAELDVPEDARILVNDRSPRAIEALNRSLELNPKARLDISQLGADRFFAQAPMADYIEIDPFGSPLEFLDPALQRMKHGGILSVSATDEAALCGTYPDTGLRKYHAFTARSPLMHEHAARILAHVVERHASRYALEAKVIFVYAHLHYLKLFFEIRSSKSRSSELIRTAEFWSVDATGYPAERRTFEEGRSDGMIGPLSAQPLYDSALLDQMSESKVQVSARLVKDLETIREEARVGGDAIDLHALSSELSLESVPRSSHIIARLGEDRATRTHFCETAIRTIASRAEVARAMRDA